MKKTNCDEEHAMSSLWFKSLVIGRHPKKVCVRHLPRIRGQKESYSAQVNRMILLGANGRIVWMMSGQSMVWTKIEIEMSGRLLLRSGSCRRLISFQL